MSAYGIASPVFNNVSIIENFQKVDLVIDISMSVDAWINIILNQT
jgi:hypothetical protein